MKVTLYWVLTKVILKGLLEELIELHEISTVNVPVSKPLPVSKFKSSDQFQSFQCSVTGPLDSSDSLPSF